MLSFNSPQGACETCEGLGVAKFFTEEKLVPNPALSIRDGAIEPIGTWETMPLWLKKGLGDFCHEVQKIYKLPKDPSKVPWQNLAEGIRRVLLVGDGRAYAYCNQPSTGHRSYLGIAMDMMFVYRESNSQTVKSRYDRYFEEVQCPSCQGERIRALGRSIKLKTLTEGFDNLDPWRSIGQCSSMPIDEAVEFFQKSKDLKTSFSREHLPEIKTDTHGRKKIFFGKVRGIICKGAWQCWLPKS
jgi:excinuclease ABC subunit A